MIEKSALRGFLGSLSLLGLYFLIVSLLSGWEFAVSQFSANWYWLLALTVGFGVQVGIFSYLRARHRMRISGKGVVVSGTTSGLAMISCCAHYLVNIVPLIGVSGLAALVGQYQNEIFGFGVLSNLVGIGYLLSRVKNA
ncbi:hypothetical protein A2890_01065 [candidate division WWE3 bacterium RIFCSPLOWO2_01_FULL_53_14]|uniref:Uncharacterized protein n=1 Tax=candidate division WWE3 bacterium RIFCSPLOWO2_01_FULL_53_14 TaxID=1802628 RepID=A0A1F4VVM6_UNCKA|nr:MAG: hypothetical protein A2890_01065 [candidate division WWE3 bacterium RIFCSPLOWO2_01_FULL_53_14]